MLIFTLLLCLSLCWAAYQDKKHLAVATATLQMMAGIGALAFIIAPSIQVIFVAVLAVFIIIAILKARPADAFAVSAVFVSPLAAMLGLAFYLAYSTRRTGRKLPFYYYFSIVFIPLMIISKLPIFG